MRWWLMTVRFRKGTKQRRAKMQAAINCFNKESRHRNDDNDHGDGDTDAMIVALQTEGLLAFDDETVVQNQVIEEQ